jgi:transmembrane sensor
VLVERGSLSADERVKLEAWLASSSRHHGAFIRARAASMHFDRLGALAGGRNVLDLPRQPKLDRRRLIAALTVATVAGVGLWLDRETIEDVLHRERYASATGEVRTVALRDGSVLLLNTATELFVRYGAIRREFSLTHGEVMFALRPDVRPFAIQVGEWILRAMTGTFSVRQGTVTDITVTEGNLTLQSANSSIQELRSIGANHEAVLDGGGVAQTRSISDAELRRRLAWRTGLVVFDGQSLHDALVEMNRYSVRQIVCTDPTLCERRIVGAFRMTDTETFISMLEATFDVGVVWSGTVAFVSPRKK